MDLGTLKMWEESHQQPISSWSPRHRGLSQGFSARCLLWCALIASGASLVAACQRDRYGQGCSHTCDCHNGALCDHVTGTCACTPGWKGATCQEGTGISLSYWKIIEGQNEISYQGFTALWITSSGHCCYQFCTHTIVQSGPLAQPVNHITGTRFGSLVVMRQRGLKQSLEGELISSWSVRELILKAGWLREERSIKPPFMPLKHSSVSFLCSALLPHVFDWFTSLPCVVPATG